MNSARLIPRSRASSLMNSLISLSTLVETAISPRLSDIGSLLLSHRSLFLWVISVYRRFTGFTVGTDWVSTNQLQYSPNYWRGQLVNSPGSRIVC